MRCEGENGLMSGDETIDTQTDFPSLRQHQSINQPINSIFYCHYAASPISTASVTNIRCLKREPTTLAQTGRPSLHPCTPFCKLPAQSNPNPPA